MQTVLRISPDLWNVIRQCYGSSLDVTDYKMQTVLSISMFININAQSFFNGVFIVVF